MPTPNLPKIPDISADRLTSQLYHLPAIVGRLGLSIANAQRALNADYTQNMKELVKLIKDLVPAANEATEADIASLIKQLAPSRYQFTETTLDFSADLSESLDVAGSVGLGAGFGAVVINAGLSVGYGRDYRAAARIKTILHAIPADDQFTAKFIDQANKLTDEGVTLPPRTEASTAVNNNLRDIIEMSGGGQLPKLAPELPLSALQRAERAADEAEQYQRSAETFKTNTEAAINDLALKVAKQMANEASNSAKAAAAAAAAAKAAADVAEPDNETAAKAAVTLAEAAQKAAKEAADAAQKAVNDASTPPAGGNG